MRATIAICIVEVGSEFGFTRCKHLRCYHLKRDYSEEGKMIADIFGKKGKVDRRRGGVKNGASAT